MTKKNLIINIAICISILITLSFSSNAQTYKKEFKSGEKAFIEGRYVDAAGFYNNAVLLIKKPSKSHLNLFYKLAYCEMRSGEYRKANNNFLKYMGLSKRFPVSEKQLAQVNEWNRWCEAELRVVEEPIPRDFNEEIEIKNITEVNSALNDYGAIFIDENRIIFTSNRKTEHDKDLIDINDDIFVVYYDKGTFSEPMRLKAAFNTKYEDMASSYCEVTQTLYFSISTDNYQSCDIYSSKRNGNNWGTAVKLGNGVNSNFWDGYPSISPDGKTLYFVSDRPGGIGGKDIYFSTQQADGNWSDARNIGRAINTRLDEITPHIDSFGTRLYFSSNRSDGLGGFDIYYSEFEASNLWSDAKNMRAPINSSGDDMFYVTTKEKGLSFLSSNRRKSMGLFDIYMVKDVVHEDEEEAIIAEDDTKTLTEDTKPDPIITEAKEKETLPITTPVPDAPKLSTDEILNAQIPGLNYKIQIGAFRKHITVSHPYFTDKMDSKEVNEEQWPPDYLYKYTIGQFNTISAAHQYRNQIRASKYSDAFTTCYYNNQRITMDEAKEIIRSNINKGQLSISK